MKKKLAIIGAKDEQEPLVLKAKEMGIETHCFAWDKKEEDTYCKGIADFFHPISILDKEKILEKCKEIKIDGVTTILNDYAVPAVAYVAENMGLPGNRYEDMLIATCKYKARQAMLKNGVKSPRFMFVQDGQIPDLKDFKYPLIVKPTDRASSIGVMKIDDPEELQTAILRARKQSIGGNVIVEEYVSGIEVSVDSISYNGIHHIFAVRGKETTGAPYFVEIAHHVPSDLDIESSLKMKTETQKALDALKIKFGACDTELKINEKGEVYLIEVNPRMGGDRTFDLISYSIGHDYVKLHINSALGCWEEPEIVNKYYSGMFFLAKGYEWVKQVIENKDSDPEIVEAKIVDEDMKDIQSSFDRYGYFIYQSDRKRTKESFINKK